MGASAVLLPTDLPADTYFVGATVRQGSHSPVTAYAGGAITIVRTPTLTVTAPVISALARCLQFQVNR